MNIFNIHVEVSHTMHTSYLYIGTYVRMEEWTRVNNMPPNFLSQMPLLLANIKLKAMNDEAYNSYQLAMGN